MDGLSIELSKLEGGKMLNSDFIILWDKFREWQRDPEKRKHMTGYMPFEGPAHLCNLYRVSHLTEIREISTVTRLLIGPHGWAIYRMLRIKRAMNTTCRGLSNTESDAT
jgi:hypothetical protein